MLFVTSTGYQILKAQEEEGRRLRAAIDEAHRTRPDLTDEDFEILARHATRSGVWDDAPREIAEYVNAVRPALAAPAPLVVTRSSAAASSSIPPALPGAPRLSEQAARDELRRAIKAAREDRSRRWWPDSWPARSEVVAWRGRVDGGWGRGWPSTWPPARRIERALQLIELDQHARLTHAEIAAAHDPPISVRTLRRRLRRFPLLGDLLPPRQ